jgi:hypothetical protein
MSLFACVNCGVVENTALCGLVWEDDPAVPPKNGKRPQRRKLICSQCNPEIGHWHGVFERKNAAQAGYVPVPGSRYIQQPHG